MTNWRKRWKGRRRRFLKGGQWKYRPDVCRDENDDGDGAKPRITDCRENVWRDVRSREVPEGGCHHREGQRQTDRIEHPHLFFSAEGVRLQQQQKKKKKKKDRQMNGSIDRSLCVNGNGSTPRTHSLSLSLSL